MAGVTLYLMNQKGAAVLDAVVSRVGAGPIAAVVGARDRGVENDYFDLIAARAATLGIPHMERHLAPVPGADAVCLAVGWRWLIPDVTRLIVLHDSLLPRYRGFAPVVSALINGEPRLGVTALLGAPGYDQGDILGQGEVEVTYPIKISAAIDLLTPIYADLAAGLVAKVVAGEALRGSPQDHSAATYSLWRDDDDYRIDWTASSARIRRFVDAVGAPYRGASSHVGGKKVRILEVDPTPDVRIENRIPGKVIFVENGTPTVVCGDGLLKILHLTEDATGRSLLPLTVFRTRFV
jgi:methionyl-tRNA formyltransferase